ncbi:hypothetical protein OCK74_02875 [Chitinophagaceae bacterium LB-8]|uniref:Uncharacterized protein n=1 Tax=Paraflavisolibacter caeni TaxID=2982496 RepID=A0A9X2XTA2_9BACT|nr:hypothetical protein [Paraflavisolibacter caeni]MCU7548037.1 hypothetical protein [Paraflavisolibacter caeni]
MTLIDNRSILFLFLFLIFNNCSFAQDEVEVDTAELQKRIDSEINIFKEWSDSLARAKGRTLPNEESLKETYPAPELSPAEQLQESERKLAQFKKIIIGLFALVIIVGVLLSKPWKKKTNSPPG